MEDLILIRPTAEYAERIMDCKKEYISAGSSMDGCGPLRRTDDPKEYIEKILIEENPETCPPPLVPATQFMLVRKSDDKILGFLQVRHCFNDYLEKYGGHIGYSVRPTERRKGYAKTMLGLALPYCKKIGIEKVLITCIDGNIGSEKTILANGGIYESTAHEPDRNVDLKRFWINL